MLVVMLTALLFHGTRQASIAVAITIASMKEWSGWLAVKRWDVLVVYCIRAKCVFGDRLVVV